MPTSITLSLPEWLERIQALHPSEIEMGLERVRHVYQQMPNKLLGPKVITLAGTNGKGTTGRLLEQILLNDGYRVGCYSSPHLVRFNERIRLNGTDIWDEALCQSFTRVDHARKDVALTFFEFTTLAALDVFARADLDVVILEMGLGARLDAVNIIEPDVAVITSIALDHQSYLGNTREQVGWEKAHVFRTDRPAVCGDAEPPESLLSMARQMGALLYQQDKDYGASQLEDSWYWQGKGVDGDLTISALDLPSVPLQNAATALQVIQLVGLPVSELAIRSAMKSTRLAGRCEYRDNPFPMLLDVAHNPESVGYLLSYLQHHFKDHSIHLLMGLLADKESDKIIRMMSDIVSECWLTDLDSARAREAPDLANEFTELTGMQASCFGSVAEALEQWRIRQKSSEQLLLITGSFYTVGAALQWLEQHQGDLNG